MRFAPTDEQDQLRDVARSFLAASPTPGWDQMVAEQSWQAIAIDEPWGGFGFGFVELALVAEELGRTLAPIPLLAHTLAATAIEQHATDAQKTRWLGALAEGARGCLAVHASLRAARSPTGWRLAGEAQQVIGGTAAELVVLPTDQGLFVVESSQVHTTVQPTLDPSRPLARLHLDTEVDDACRIPDATCETALERGWVLLAAEAVGAAERCLEETVAYAKVRTQFGRPIGSFQAIQHKAADMLVLVESARSATWYAAWAIDEAHPDRVNAARTARAFAADALFRCAAETIQCHGGIGFTWEHMAHRYFKRARADRSLLGSPQSHRDALADQLLGAL